MGAWMGPAIVVLLLVAYFGAAVWRLRREGTPKKRKQAVLNITQQQIMRLLSDNQSWAEEEILSTLRGMNFVVGQVECHYYLSQLMDKKLLDGRIGFRPNAKFNTIFYKVRT